MLPASKFDEIYEACKDGGTYRGKLFFRHVLDESTSAFMVGEREWYKTKYDSSDETRNKIHLEAYRTGEIRDAGRYPDKPEYVYGKGTSFTPWYKLDHKVFDPLVDDPRAFWFKVQEEYPRLYSACTLKTEDSHTRFIRRNRMVKMYKEGILRDAGPMGGIKSPSTNIHYRPYDHAFSVKDGRMVVDWGALEVTKENALEISIASWKWLYQWMLDNDGWPKRGASVCALCKMYIGPSFCPGCPISKKTGSKCGCTPYDDYVSATNKHEALDACRDEIAFLEGLR
jgi:hypothetical protein